MENVLDKIKEFRKKRGYTYEAMAHELNTSPAAYRKIELNQTKLTVERLMQISSILEAKLEDLLDIKSDKLYRQEIKDNGIGYQDVEHFYTENKEMIAKIDFLYNERIKDKDSMIHQLTSIMEKLNLK
jgi:transcriptional regulator with XRE-family HTH domain